MGVGGGRGGKEGQGGGALGGVTVESEGRKRWNLAEAIQQFASALLGVEGFQQWKGWHIYVN